METIIGLIIIAIGSFGQSSSYVPINKVTDSPVMLAFSWSILMSLNVIFSNVWGLS